MLILVLAVFSLYLFQPQTSYKIHTTIQEHKLIALKLIYQHLIVQTNIYFLMKLVIHMTIKHNLPHIQLFFKEGNHI